MNLFKQNLQNNFNFSGSLRPFELNDEHMNFKKSHSYDPFPVIDHHHHHQINKRNNENFRKRKNNTAEALQDCNGGITASSQIQRSDYEPLLLTKKRWHSLELETVRTEREESSSGCEEHNGTNKKSLNRIKSWLVGILNKNKSPNGQGDLLAQQQTSSTTTKNRMSVENESCMSVV